MAENELSRRPYGSPILVSFLAPLFYREEVLMISYYFDIFPLSPSANF